MAAPTRKELLKHKKKFESVKASHHASLLNEKLRLCRLLFQFQPVEFDEFGEATVYDPPKDKKSQVEEKCKQAKIRILTQLLDYMAKKRILVNTEVGVELVRTVATNILRTLPPKIREVVDPTDDEPVFEPSWPHTSLVYELFLRFLLHEQVDQNLLRRLLGKRFIVEFVALFDSEDPREREYLKTILHRLYSKLTPLRSFIRRVLRNIFFSAIYEGVHNNGIAELLEILGSIINGFTNPIKREHVKFLHNVLIPMHKISYFPMFHSQLSYCVVQYVSKESPMAEDVINGLLRYWPVLSGPKQVLFLGELEEILETTKKPEFERMLDPVFRRIGECIASEHFQVSERALIFWSNEVLLPVLEEYRGRILPLIFPALQKNIDRHWSISVRSLAMNTLSMCIKSDEGIAKRMMNEHTARLQRATEQKRARNDLWKELEKKVEQQKKESA